MGKLEQNITSFSKIVGKFQNFSTIQKSYGIIKAERGNNMFKKERINNFKTLVDSYKEIDKKIVDIKVAMHDLEKLSYNEDIDFLENLEKQLENMNIEFYKLKQEIIKKVEKFFGLSDVGLSFGYEISFFIIHKTWFKFSFTFFNFEKFVMFIFAFDSLAPCWKLLNAC